MTDRIAEAKARAKRIIEDAAERYRGTPEPERMMREALLEADRVVREAEAGGGTEAQQ